MADSAEARPLLGSHIELTLLRRYLILVAIALALMSFPTRSSLFKKLVQAKIAAVSPPAANVTK